ncbi:MAG TPA: nucleotide exchange factor GrpE [Gemmatimonadaceae bacterium]|nr:nucleotide exchange factor GrpE [Gemmatimonadaceae bacterium]
MEPRENDDFDPGAADGGPSSEDTFERGAGSSGVNAEDDLGIGSSSADRRFAEMQDKYLRLAAEYDNFRKRTARERADLSARAQADLVRQLLDGLDDLARFAHIDPATTDATTLHQGVDMVEKKLQKALTSAGMELVDPVNQSFDPQTSEAVATEPALSPEDDHVVSRVYQVGYRFNGQLLRPARVVVKQWNG